MSQQKDLEESAINEFTELLQKQGFSAPIIQRNGWMTRIDYLKDSLGIELEFDWRESDIFLLVVRLKNGTLPKGYYVESGRKCRKHLVNIIREQKWTLSSIASSTRQATASRKTVDDLKATLIYYKSLLLSYLDKLQAAGDRIFD
jgi:hypothetical protein